MEMNNWRRNLIVGGALLIFLVLGVREAEALVNSSLSEQTGGNNAVLERNSTYRVLCQVKPQVATYISGIDTSCRRRLDTFESVVLSDRIMKIPGMITWETSKVNKDFKTDEGWVTAQYVKANTVGADWSTLAQPYPIFWLDLKVKRNAPLGSSNINYTEDATISGVGGSEEKGLFDDFNYEVIADQTAPVTSPQPAEGYYKTDQNISILVNETPSSIYYRVGLVGDYLEYDGSISVVGVPGECTTTEIWMKSVDSPYETDQNWEVPHYATFVIDRENPTMTNFSASPATVGMEGRWRSVLMSPTARMCWETMGVRIMSGWGGRQWTGLMGPMLVGSFTSGRLTVRRRIRRF